MAMFDNNSSNSSKKNQPVMPTNINPGTTLAGNISSDGDIRLDGAMTGNITTTAKVIIGPQGFITGDIVCSSADVFGKIKGNVKVKELLFLKASASIDGDIFTAKLVVENGATFNGSCSMNSTFSNQKTAENVSKQLVEEVTL
jgi:cytoskeletal protein CcmA (bactofilin family)